MDSVLQASIWLWMYPALVMGNPLFMIIDSEIRALQNKIWFKYIQSDLYEVLSHMPHNSDIQSISRNLTHKAHSRTYLPELKNESSPLQNLYTFVKKIAEDHAGDLYTKKYFLTPDQLYHSIYGKISSNVDSDSINIE